MSDKNWIKLNRKIFSNFLWQDNEPFDKRSAWIDLLMLANHKDHEMWHKGEVIMVKRGDVNRSMNWLAERWHWSFKKVLRFLDALEKAKMVRRNSTSNGTTITIENYNIYQGSGISSDISNDRSGDISNDISSAEVTDTIQERKRINKKEKNDKNGLIKGSLQVRTDHSDILNNPLLCDEAKEKWINIREKAFAYQNRKKVNQ